MRGCGTRERSPEGTLGYIYICRRALPAFKGLPPDFVSHEPPCSSPGQGSTAHGSTGTGDNCIEQPRRAHSWVGSRSPVTDRRAIPNRHHSDTGPSSFCKPLWKILSVPPQLQPLTVLGMSAQEEDE